MICVGTDKEVYELCGILHGTGVGFGSSVPAGVAGKGLSVAVGSASGDGVAGGISGECVSVVGMKGASVANALSAVGVSRTVDVIVVVLSDRGICASVAPHPHSPRTVNNIVNIKNRFVFIKLLTNQNYFFIA